MKRADKRHRITLLQTGSLIILIGMRQQQRQQVWLGKQQSPQGRLPQCQWGRIHTPLVALHLPQQPILLTRTSADAGRSPQSHHILYTRRGNDRQVGVTLISENYLVLMMGVVYPVVYHRPVYMCITETITPTCVYMTLLSLSSLSLSL